MIGKIACQDAFQPVSLFRDRAADMPPKYLCYLPELGYSAVFPAFSLELERSFTGAPADMSEAQKVKGFRSRQPPFFSTVGCKATELDQPGFFLDVAGDQTVPAVCAFPVGIELHRFQIRTRSQDHQHSGL